MTGSQTHNVGSEDERLLLHAYLDGELDAATALAFECRIAADPKMQDELSRLQALRAALSSHVAKDVASEALQARIARIARPAHSTDRRFDWRALAASAVIAACLASGGTYLALNRQQSASAVADVVASHQRYLLSGQTVDVASSDRHTVKPWFNSKLAISPVVIDLAGDGFPLVGGRVDVVSGQSVPVLVYKRREHAISVVAVPMAGMRDDEASPALETKDGYKVLTWRGADFTYSAVSDVALEDLRDFIDRWRAAAKGM